MERTIKMFSAIVLSLSILSCKNENSGDKSQKVALGEKKKTASITQKKEDVVNKIEKGKIENVSLTYSELTLNNEDLGSITETLKNGSEIYLNGCNTQSIKNIKIEGIGDHLTLTIKSLDGKVIFEKKDFSIDKSITMSERDKIVLGSLSITQASKTLFQNQVLVSGCN
jgi:hypothetical protein